MKKHIFALTPNPALDLSGTVDEIRPNEKSYVHDVSVHPGGNAINVARILSRLGVSSVVSGFLGGGVGQEVEDLLIQEGLSTQFIPILGQTRISVTVSKGKDHQQTRLTFPGPVIRRAERDRLRNQFRRQKNLRFLVVGGSLPPGFTAQEVDQLIKMARAKNVLSIVDCPGPILRHVVRANPFMIKPNLIEFQQLVGKNVRTIPSVIKAAQPLLKHVSMLCISSVENGTLLLDRENGYYGRIPQVKIKSTVGAGDSMVGAMISQLVKGNFSLEDLLRWGLAASAATLSRSGTELGKGSEIRRLYTRKKVRKIF